MVFKNIIVQAFENYSLGFNQVGLYLSGLASSLGSMRQESPKPCHATIMNDL